MIPPSFGVQENRQNLSCLLLEGVLWSWWRALPCQLGGRLHPKKFGDLRYVNLARGSTAIKLCRAWIARTELDKPWRHLGVPLNPNGLAHFNYAARLVLGNGNNALFMVRCVAWGLFACSHCPWYCWLVLDITKPTCMVADGLTDGYWLRDIKAKLTIEQFIQLMNNWDAISEVQLVSTQEDSWKWDLESSGRFSSKSKYKASF